MGKTKICSVDQLVYSAAARAYNILGQSDVPTLQYLLENPTTGFLVLYKQGSCKCCDSKCNAKVFAAAIDALATVNYFILPVFLQQNPTVGLADVSPAYVAYLTLLTLLQTYVNNKCKCKDSKVKKQYEKIFTSAFNTIASEGASEVTTDDAGTITTTFVLNINLITATARYVNANINCEAIPITNAIIAGVRAISMLF